MYKRLPYFLFIISTIAISVFFILWGTGDTYSSVDKKQKEEFKEQSLFITGLEKFKDLERPPVMFSHDRHTAALQKEGCAECHSKDKKQKDKIIFSMLKGIEPGVKNDKKTLMDSYHSMCITCHEKRSNEGKKFGGAACGDCHVVRKIHKVERVAIDRDYYLQNLKDAYHNDCSSCHKSGDREPKKADGLNWNGFYVKVTEARNEELPRPFFGYFLHNKHEKGMNKKCESCHHIYDKGKKEVVYKRMAESSCRDCHRAMDIMEDGLKVRSMRKAVHVECINCHMRKKEAKEKAGPVFCGNCHKKWKEIPLKELAGIQKPYRGQPVTAMINIDGARMKSVPFNHKFHEENTRSCRSCHHDKLASCKECHTIRGDKKKGGGITLAEAYHNAESQWSCIGCHESKKSEKTCFGCHNTIKGGLTKTSCLVCHTGSGRVSGAVGSPSSLIPSGTMAKMTINILEKNYDPLKFPHLDIVQKLTDISNKSMLARTFHSQSATICMGCHHYTPMTSGMKAPQCSACHSLTRKRSVDNRPSLLGAYHRQCLGCHKEMALKLKKPGCDGCHAKKKKKDMAKVKQDVK